MNSYLHLCLNQLVSNVRVGRNAVVSPVLLRASVAMLGVGCSGRSLDEVLQFDGSKTVSELKTSYFTSAAILRYRGWGLVNGAWIDERRCLKPSYERCLLDFRTRTRDNDDSIEFQDFVNQADEAVDEINEWWDFQTSCTARKFIERQHINPWTQLILGQACWDGGSVWNKYNYEWSAKKDFYLDNGDKVSDVTFNTRSEGGNSYLHTSFRDFQVVEIPYGDDGLAMRLILPERRDGLMDVVEEWNADTKLWDFKMDYYKSLHEFWIPSFNLCYSHDINFGSEFFYPEEILEPAGSGKDEVKMLQFVQLAVDGHTSYPYTATAPPVTHMNMVGGEKTSFVADHPFMFIIRDLSGLVLFAGAVMNPVDGQEEDD